MKEAMFAGYLPFFLLFKIVSAQHVGEINLSVPTGVMVVPTMLITSAERGGGREVRREVERGREVEGEGREVRREVERGSEVEGRGRWRER